MRKEREACVAFRYSREAGKIRRNKSGTTMVEVLVAVLVVMFVMALFSRSVTAAVGLYNRSAAVISDTEKFNAAYYQKDNIGKRETLPGVGFQLKLKEQEKETIIDLPLGIVKKFTDNGTAEEPGTGIERYSIESESITVGP